MKLITLIICTPEIKKMQKNFSSAFLLNSIIVIFKILPVFIFKDSE